MKRIDFEAHYEDSNECVQFLEGLPITGEDRDKIFFRNAGQFGIRRELLARVSANQTLRL